MPPNDSRVSPSGARNEASPDGISLHRRRLLRSGLGAAPVLMSVASKPVLAAGQCVTASSFTSLDVSGDNATTLSCIGRTPEFWKQEANFGQWPEPYYAVRIKRFAATMFDAVCGSYGGYPGKTCLQVLNIGGTDVGRDGLARHIVAALLNAQKGWTPPEVLSVEMVKHIWSEFTQKGYFEPTAGVRWYPDSSLPATAGSGITAFLKSTMTS